MGKAWSVMKLVHTVFKNGERYPLLRGEDGVPLWYPTLYATSQLRNAAKAPNTIVANLTAVRLLLIWCDEENIDIETHFSKGDFFTTQQVESLSRFLQTKVSELGANEGQIQLVRNKESTRARLKYNINKVSANTQYLRLSYVADYLHWFACRVVERNKRHVDADSMALIKHMTDSLRARRPVRANDLNKKRMGLEKEQRSELLALVTPSHESNPFSEDLKIRNELIVNLLYQLGVRQGELLSIRIRDIDFSKNEIVIPRRHDDPDDPRSDQPVAKTMDRRLPLSKELAELISNYIVGERRNIKPARRHDFLLVVHKVGPYLGQPLSSRGLARVFKQIQDARPDSFSNLTPHLLRHTWNDRFSELADEKGIDEAREEKMRSYSMGWKEGSGTSAIYTRRHIEREAQKAALELQRSLKIREKKHD